MVKKVPLFFIVFLAAVFFVGPSPSAQNDPTRLLSREVIEKIAGEASGKICFEHIRDLSVFSKWYGSDDMERAAAQIVVKAQKYGLADAHIERFPVDMDTYYGMQKPWYAWNCERGELRIIRPFYELFSSYEANTSCVLVNSRNADVEAEVVYVGGGTEAKDYDGKDVLGKLVLATGNPFDVSRIAILEKGAAGILSGLALNRPGIPDNEVYQTRICPWNEDRTKVSTFGFSLSASQTRRLIHLLEKGETVILRASVRAEVRVPGFHQGVTATLPGTLFPDEEIILTAHLDHPRPGAHDNNSGCAVLLEVARVINALVAQKVIEPPKRTIRFYWTPHVWGCDMLFNEHPELLAKTIANINVDCVGIDQSKISSALTVVRPPFSRPSYLADVFESFLQYLIVCNNSTFGRVPYGPEIRDHDGSSNVFNGRTVPWVDYSDHIFFNSGSVGIPGVMIIDLPFGSHHSQNDRIELLDPTQLKRVAFLVAAAAYTVASIGSDEAEGIIDEVFERGMVRLGADMKLAKSILNNAQDRDRGRSWLSVQALVDSALAREKAALTSTRVFIRENPRAFSYLSGVLKKTETFEKESRAEISAFFKAVSREKQWTPREFVPTNEEENLSRIVPLPNPKLKGTLGILNVYPSDKYQYQKYSPMTAYFYELLNYMDGHRNLLEIIRAVEAECLSSSYQAFTRQEALEFAELLKKDGVISYR